MKSMPVTERGSAKKQYVKPEVKLVSLRPEEAVLGACKTGSTVGPGQPTCNFSGSKCSAVGS